MHAQAYTPPPHAPLNYLYSDSDLVVTEKPSGLLSVPGRGADKSDCLISRVQLDYPDAQIVHRLDMETSGLMVLARHAEAHRRLSILFQDRIVKKRYVAVVDGLLAADRGTVELPLITDWPNRPLQKVDFSIGKPSTTHYRVMSRDFRLEATRVELSPFTGRSHQLRVHLLALGHPILGDALYATAPARAKAGRLLLHATRLEFPHPLGGDRLSFDCPASF
ncbi:RNA pseudouridine synthase [Azoarcus sp. L1K30]|uniref:pseudouridine synthase n=1 Tax=Azoarcus sp. L1K30 TaxID=2820277 RepID=UPI001B82E2F7|nr:pseudouridine synthase [Azoarcus sp. L1K30]MBR0565658.1 RNA pseudouridine synthase [Azoarcus sp. L1K30]